MDFEVQGKLNKDDHFIDMTYTLSREIITHAKLLRLEQRDESERERHYGESVHETMTLPLQTGSPHH